MPNLPLARILVSFLIAATAGFVLASLLFTGVNLVRLTHVGAAMSFGDVLRTAWFDLRGLAPALEWQKFGTVIFIGLAIAFAAGAGLRLLARRSGAMAVVPWLYPLAGAAAMATILALSFQTYEVYAYAGGRGWLGNIAQCLAGGSAGLLFQRLSRLPE